MEFTINNLKNAVSKAEAQLEQFSKRFVEVEALVLPNDVFRDGGGDPPGGSIKIPALTQTAFELGEAAAKLDQEMEDIEVANKEANLAVEHAMALLEERCTAFIAKNVS